MLTPAHSDLIVNYLGLAAQYTIEGSYDYDNSDSITALDILREITGLTNEELIEHFEKRV